MLSTKEINDVYEQYKKDLKVKFKTNKLIIYEIEDSIGAAQIGDVELSSAELLLGDIFYNSKVSNRYLQQILYHEFTHITDYLTFLTGITNKREHKNLLFPYSEFHAAQIELCKKLELFYNPQKEIKTSTSIYDMYNITTLKNFLNGCNKAIELRKINLEENPSFENVQFVIYQIIYNLGYYSVCQKFNVEGNLININLYPYVSSELNEIKELLINTAPSNDLCMKTNKIINDITAIISEKYNLTI